MLLKIKYYQQMKQITRFFLFLITLLLLHSCSNNDYDVEVPALKTTSVEITTHKSFLTGKNVNDPSLFGNIKDITVTATQTTTGYKASTLFTISNNANDTSTYTLNNVQEGINTFEASATSVSAPKVPSFSSTSRNTSNPGVWNTINAQTASQPYATYSGSLGTTVIDPDKPIILNIPMNTNNGRFIAYFRGSSKNFQTTVTPYIDEVAQTTFTITNVIDFYWIWNDADCIAGKNVRFQCVTVNRGNNTRSTANIPNVTIKSHTTSQYAYDIPETGDTYSNIPRN